MAGEALWSGRFGRGMDRSTLDFTSSLSVDKRLASYDVIGSLAHVMMLRKCGILSGGDADKIVVGLRSILSDLRNGKFVFNEDLEDVHTNIENALTERIGPAGRKLHTGRSRNDQVAVDLRMYLRDAVLDAVNEVNSLVGTLTDIARRTQGTIMPGFTHMQHAQTVSVAQHMMAHAFRLGRDADRFLDAFERVNVCPLGAGALAGTTYPIDRTMTSDLLGFRHPTENSMDSVSDRDFVMETAFCASALATHLSSMAEELVIWSSPEFGFVEIDDKHATGSSMMPQKKNPDIAELIRGRTGGVIGDLVSLMTMMKGLPLTYNRDLQEDKGPVMHALDSVASCAVMMREMIAAVKFNEERMRRAALEGYMNATDLADYLVNKGKAFRDAHDAVGSAVRYCIKEKKRLEELSVKELKGFSELIEKDVFDILSPEACVERRNSYGGTSQQSVERQIHLSAAATTKREERALRGASLIDERFKELAG